MPDDDDIEIVVEESPEEAAAPGGSASEGLDDLQRQLEESRASGDRDREALRVSEERRQQAERVAQQRGAEAQGSALRELDASFDSVSNALVAAQQEADSKVSAKARLMADGDYEGAAKLDFEIGKLAAKIDRLEDGKSALEAKRTEDKARAAQPATQPRQETSNAKEAYIASKTPKTAAWLRQNDRFFSDPSFQKKVISANDYIVNVLGIAADTDEYFQKVEESVGTRQAAAPARQETTSMAARSAPRQSAPPPAARTAAAPSREVPGAARTPGGRMQVSLTAAEIAFARQSLPPEVLGLDEKGRPRDPVKVYALNKQAMIDSGKTF